MENNYENNNSCLTQILGFIFWVWLIFSIWYVVDDYQTNVQTTQIELQEMKSQLHTINNSLDSISTKQDK